MKRFRMKYSKFVIFMSIVFLLLALAVILYFVFYSGGSYLPAWIFTLLVALVLLSMLSIPRFVILSDISVEVHSIMDLTVVRFDDITSIKILSKKEMRYSFPLGGISCFFGYYGHYLDLRKMRIFQLYTRKWGNFVEIIYLKNKRLIVGVEDVETFMELLQRKID